MNKTLYRITLLDGVLTGICITAAPAAFFLGNTWLAVVGVAASILCIPVQAWGAIIVSKSEVKP
jgi:hypothetical protein